MPSSKPSSNNYLVPSISNLPTLIPSISVSPSMTHPKLLRTSMHCRSCIYVGVVYDVKSCASAVTTKSTCMGAEIFYNAWYYYCCYEHPTCTGDISSHAPCAGWNVYQNRSFPASSTPSISSKP